MEFRHGEFANSKFNDSISLTLSKEYRTPNNNNNNNGTGDEYGLECVHNAGEGTAPL